MIAEWCSNCGGETDLPNVEHVAIGYKWKCTTCSERLLPCAQFDCANGDCCQDDERVEIE